MANMDYLCILRIRSHTDICPKLDPFFPNFKFFLAIYRNRLLRIVLFTLDDLVILISRVVLFSFEGML